MHVGAVYWCTINQRPHIFLTLCMQDSTLFDRNYIEVQAATFGYTNISFKFADGAANLPVSFMVQASPDDSWSSPFVLIPAFQLAAASWTIKSRGQCKGVDESTCVRATCMRTKCACACMHARTLAVAGFTWHKKDMHAHARAGTILPVCNACSKGCSMRPVNPLRMLA